MPDSRSLSVQHQTDVNNCFIKLFILTRTAHLVATASLPMTRPKKHDYLTCFGHKLRAVDARLTQHSAVTSKHLTPISP